MATTPQRDTEVLAHEMRETLGRLVRRLRAEPGPSVGRLAVLGRLDRGGPSNIRDLAEAERMRHQSMAQIVEGLEEKGLVTKRPDDEDRRRIVVELTPEGTELVHETRARRESWLAGALERELDPEEREALRRAVELLDRVAGAPDPG
jgi:DNA-binding MarR family transcriptional regulator